MNIQLLTPNLMSISKRCAQEPNSTIRRSNQNGLNAKTVSYPNLSPLAQDTVSFSGGSGVKLLQQRTKDISFQLGTQVYEEAQRPLRDLLKTLKSGLKKFIQTPSHSENPIVEIKGRVKKPRSIIEKAISRRLYTKKEINKMGDVIGIRINLADADQKTFDKAFSGLGDMVKQGELKVLEVENYRLTKKDSFISTKTLDKFENICNKTGNIISRREQAIPNGYTAVHLTVELKSGHLAEIQVMTKNMEQVKDIEDFFYKLRCNKDFAEEYKPLEDMMKKNMKGLTDFQKETLNYYIKDSYAYARTKEAGAPMFLPFPYSLPQDLSYANIKKIKTECDVLKRAKQK